MNVNIGYKRLAKANPIWVWPKDLINVHSARKVRTRVIDLSGDWDKLGKSVLDGHIYKSFKHRLSGTPWEDTTTYKKRPLKKPHWPRKLPVWDKMLADIVPNGFTQRPLKDPIDEYMSILIGRNGDMFIYNGIHRFVCCLLSEVRKKIPVKVLARHTEWAEFKQSCYNYQQRRGKLYSQIPHPDLESIPYYWTNERAELIAKHSLYPKGTVVDLGAHWGITSYILSQHGFKCTAIEKSKKQFVKLTKISKFPGLSFNMMLDDFTIYDFDIDTFVMLNIAHHFIIDKVKRKTFTRFMQANSCKEIFYQSHRTDDKWAPHMMPQKMLKLIMDSAEMNNALSLKTFNGRELWHLSR